MPSRHIERCLFARYVRTAELAQDWSTCSTQSATRSSRTTRKQNLNNRWLHKQGDNYLDARRAFFGSAQDLIVVEDTTLDPRFATHPFVAGEPFIRFYAAARLVVRGQTVGTLCAYGVEPKKVAPAQVEQLQAMAGAVTALLAQRAALPGAP